MGELILAKTPVAANPYYIEELSLNIYSLEELSYYVYHNVWLLSADFMSVSLVGWIDRELSLHALAETLDKMIRDSAPLSLFVSEILTFDGYLTKGEIRDTLSIINSFENKSEAECKKLRADRLFESGRIVSSIFEYQSLLESRENLSATLCGDIYHNLGTALTRLFFMKEASDSFKSAYEANRNRESLNAYLLSLLLSGDEEKFKLESKKYLLSDEEMMKLQSKVYNITYEGRAKDFSDRLDRLKADNSESESYKDELLNIIKGAEEEYRKICRL